MKRSLLTKVLLPLTTLALAAPAYAQDGGANQYDLRGMAVLAAGLAIGVAAGLCGMGQGKAVAAACEGTARNPNAGKQLFTLTLVGLAFIESLAIYALVVSFSLMATKP